MSKTEPTPGPWRKHQTEADAIVGPDRKPIAMINSLGKRPEAEDAANLTLILRAVNAHADLLAALEKSVALAQSAPHDTECACLQRGGKCDCLRQDLFDVLLPAIARARGDA